MKILFTALWTRLKGELGFLVLLAVASAGAWLYVQYQQVRADRDRLQHWAEVTCAASGAPFAATGAAKPGQLCAARVTHLANYKASADEQTAQLLAQAMADHDARQSADTLAARAAADAARDAAHAMEAADAKAERTNLVDAEWFAALNRVAGLRPSRSDGHNR